MSSAAHLQGFAVLRFPEILNKSNVDSSLTAFEEILEAVVEKLEGRNYFV